MQRNVVTIQTAQPVRDAYEFCAPFVKLNAIMRFALMGALLALLSSSPQRAARSAPQAVDAEMLVGQMVATYQHAQTFSETSECYLLGRDGKEYIQTCQIKYKRPNLLYVETRDPIQGTYLSTCNGHIAMFYTGKQNIFTRRTAPGTVALAVAEVSKASIRLIGTPQYQILNPLSFLNGKGRIVEANKYEFVRMETADGRRAALITAKADLNWLVPMTPAYLQITFSKRAISLWIDPVSKTLVRASCDLQWEYPKNKQIVHDGIRFVETHRNIKIDGLLRDEDFNVAPPNKAQEKFQ